MSGAASPEPGAREWLRIAEHDLRLAEHGLTIQDDPPFEAVCFQAQQCAEKALKALLVSRQIRFPRTHDLRALHQMLPPDLALPVPPQELLSLNRYTIEGRYPGPWDPADRAEAESAVATARNVLGAARRKLV